MALCTVLREQDLLAVFDATGLHEQRASVLQSPSDGPGSASRRRGRVASSHARVHFLVRVACSKCRALIKPRAGCRTAMCPFRRHQETPRQNRPSPARAATPQVALPGARSFSLATTAAPTPLDLDAPKCVEDSGRECGGTLFVDGIEKFECGASSAGWNSMICLQAASMRSASLAFASATVAGMRGLGYLCELFVEPLHAPRGSEFDHLAAGCPPGASATG